MYVLYELRIKSTISATISTLHQCCFQEKSSYDIYTITNLYVRTIYVCATAAYLSLSSIAENRYFLQAILIHTAHYGYRSLHGIEAHPSSSLMDANNACHIPVDHAKLYQGPNASLKPE